MAVEDEDVSDFIDDFLAHREYDPEKAHDYYMRTRELKGRKPAAKPPRNPNKSLTPDEFMAKARLLTTKEATARRVKAIPKLNPAQLKEAQDWDKRAQKIDSIFKKSGLDKKDNEIRYSNMSKEEKAAAYQKLDQHPVMKRLDPIIAKMQKEFLTNPVIVRYYEILDAQQNMKQDAAEKKANRLYVKPGKVLGAQM